jgi:hypothetical protein
MDPDERVAGIAGPGLSPGLQAATARQNAMAPHAFQPMSVLSQFGPSLVAANASAPGMKDRVLLGNQIAPNINSGSSSETAQNAMLLRLQGQNSE